MASVTIDEMQECWLQDRARTEQFTESHRMFSMSPIGWDFAMNLVPISHEGRKKGFVEQRIVLTACIIHMAQLLVVANASA